MSKLQSATSCDVIMNFSSAPGTATLAYLNGYVYYNVNWITMIFIQSIHNKSWFIMIMLTKLSFMELKCYRCCLRIYRTPLVFIVTILLGKLDILNLLPPLQSVNIVCREEVAKRLQHMCEALKVSYYDNASSVCCPLLTFHIYFFSSETAELK